MDKEEEIMPPCLQPIKLTNNDANTLIKKIEAMPLSKDSDKLAFIK